MRPTIVIASLALATSASEAIRGFAHVAQAPRPWSRATAPVSDVLTHSAMVACPGGAARRRAAPTALRAATWNIGAARYASVGDIGAELRAMQADIIALQEVDLRLRRTGFTDQPGALAAALGFHYVFAASIKWDGGDYGLALLSRWPLASVERHRLDVVGVGEPRIVLEVTICANGRPLRVFNHHADVGGASRQSGLARLTEIVQPSLGRGAIVAGDFNAGPDTPGVRALRDAGLVDVGAERNEPTARNGRIDYLLVDALLIKGLRRTQVWVTDKSDHHALVAEFRIE
ncbi:MAG TPA: endonuclease/exonuclease/phosphatase family protein [Vicinamibacterales bacterium]|nr:endonuclease/exonuclease/phosphatase family protein [Vicinamibacterales bacterium]